MRRLLIPLVLLCFSFHALPSPAQVRKVIPLNMGWEFRMHGEEAWRRVDLPHDFQIEQPWVAPAAHEQGNNTDAAANTKSRLSGRGFKEMGKGCYRYRLVPTDEMRGRRLLLDFGGIMYTGDVFMNGVRIGGTDYGYVGFEIDITHQLQWNQENILTVMADTGQPDNSRWYTGGGLFRTVNLVMTDKNLYFARHPLRITTRDNRFVNITAEVTNAGKMKNPRLVVKVMAADGTVVVSEEQPCGKFRSTTMEVPMPEMEVPDPQLWDTDSPYLYKVCAQLVREDGTVADETTNHFGIRTLDIDPAFGLKLNGRKVLLKGFANHHTLGALGAAAYPRAIEKRILLMKEFGINHIRTSHNPYSREFIELCDKHGILVVNELYDKWTQQHTGGRVPWEQHWQYDVPEWVKRDRNSPSVVMWSLGNELQQNPHQAFNDWGVTAYRLQKTLLQRYDSTRKVTVAMHPRYRNWQTDSLPCDLAMITDVQSYNYRYMYFPGDSRRFPWMTFYQSEASTADMGPNFFGMNLDKVIGLAYWGAIDYLGESQGWPAKGWAQGVFDISLEPKPKAWLMKSLFKPEEPTVHIAIVDSKNRQMWNGIQTGNDGMSDHWNRTPGDTLTLYTYTNEDEVELIMNGRSLGRKRNPKEDPKRRNQICWEGIVYQPGYIEARTGKARHRMETTGKAVRLMAYPDLACDWKADGQDLQHIRIIAVDSKGRRTYTAQDELRFSVEGDARIVAVTNGDINSDELNCTGHRRLWNGSAMVILRAGTQAGKVVLTISSDSFKTVKETLTMQ